MGFVNTDFVIPTDHPCLPGHFPGRPLVPGVVLLDHVIAAIESEHGPLPPLRLPQVKFLQPLLPGEAARIELDGAAPRWRFRVLRGDTLLASGDVIAEAGASVASSQEASSQEASFPEASSP